jgi:peptidoglycan/LPS O-acetylase OafA/YrhL
MQFDRAVDPARPVAGRIGFLDALRFIAAGSVMFQHVAEHVGNKTVRAVVELGPGVFGVALFFIISGFIIPFSTRRTFEPVQFALRRVLRIYPLVLAAFLLALAMGATGLISRFSFMVHASPVQWAANLLLVQDLAGVRPFLNVTWTLIIELGWYSLFGAMLVLYGNRAGRILGISGHVAMVALILLSLMFGFRLPLGRIGMIYAAIVGFQFYRQWSGEISMRNLTCHVIAFVAIMLAGNYVAFGVFRHPRIDFAQAAWPWLAATLLFALVFGWRKLRQSILLDNPLFRWLGTVSYSLYMVHIIAIAFALEHAGADWIWAALAITALLSVVGYYGIERPGIALGRRIGAPRPAHGPAQSQA